MSPITISAFDMNGTRLYDGESVTNIKRVSVTSSDFDSHVESSNIEYAFYETSDQRIRVVVGGLAGCTCSALKPSHVLSSL